MRVVKKHILATLEDLDRLYNSAATAEATYYSKLAIIELCGWIELTMDSIVEGYGNRKFRTTSYIRDFRNLVKKNYGFGYRANFKKMMSQTIGMHYMEKLEIPLIASGEIAILEATLENLKENRNRAAHTYINTTTIFQAPSVTKAQLLIVYPILKKINASVNNL